MICAEASGASDASAAFLRGTLLSRVNGATPQLAANSKRVSASESAASNGDPHLPLRGRSRCTGTPAFPTSKRPAYERGSLGSQSVCWTADAGPATVSSAPLLTAAPVTLPRNHRRFSFRVGSWPLPLFRPNVESRLRLFWDCASWPPQARRTCPRAAAPKTAWDFPRSA